MMERQMNKSERDMVERIRKHYAFMAKLARSRHPQIDGKRVSLAAVIEHECAKAIDQMAIYLPERT